MAEHVRWADDGTPESPRFNDIYRSRGPDGLGGLQQARHVFLGGCGLPALWQGRQAFTILETGFGLGLNFLATWQAWRQDARRPRLLHYVATEAFPVGAPDILRSASVWPELTPLVEQLCERWWGLLPGTHRLSLDGGQVLLTLGVDDSTKWLGEHRLLADAVYLDGFDPERNPQMWSSGLMDALARHTRPGAPVATWTVARSVRDGLTRAGFDVEKAPGLPPKRHRLHGRFNPAWANHKPLPQPIKPGRVVVVGAGLAGAHIAASLARRGCEVTVLDSAPEPAAGASGLPAGLFGPHLSSDDAWLSRLVRSGVRTTWQCLSDLPAMQGHWDACGILERRPARERHWPYAGQAFGSDWTAPASPAVLAQAGLTPDTAAWWHARAGWVQPGAWVRALLGSAGVHWRAQAPVAQIRQLGSQWQACDAHGEPLESADWMIVAAGPATASLVPVPLPLNALRGQITGVLSGADTPALPRFATNGHGCLIPSIPAHEGPTWYCGSTFDRSCSQPLTQESDNTDNLQKLRDLLPSLGTACANSATPDRVRAWAGVRCTVSDRVPLLGPVDPEGLPGLWVCTAMGARGLSLAALCGEIAAAWAFHEPLPIPDALASHLKASRWPATASVKTKSSNPITKM